jgi:hypothetical protein
LNKRSGIITGDILVFQPQQISFPLRIAANLQEHGSLQDRSEGAGKHQRNAGVPPDLHACFPTGGSTG